MTRKIITCLLLATSILFSCKNASKTSEDTTADSTTTNEETPKQQTADTARFDINSIPLSEVEIGQFPYLSYPEGYNFNYEKDIKQQNIKDFDKEYFAVAGKLISVEGKTYKVRIEKDSKNERKFNAPLVEKYYTDKILELGGVQVNNVTVPQAEINRVGNKELVEKQYGFSIDYNLLDDIKTFVIRRKDKEIWIQITLMNEEVGKLTVLEK